MNEPRSSVNHLHRGALRPQYLPATDRWAVGEDDTRLVTYNDHVLVFRTPARALTLCKRVNQAISGKYKELLVAEAAQKEGY